jgi:uncharacterized membrane protein YsdA (DUF1294 family)
MPNNGLPPNVKQAPVSEWDRQKGYGWLGVGQDRIFLHRRDFIQWHRPPAVGEMIQYVAGWDASGRRCATRAVQALQTPRPAAVGWTRFLQLGLLLIVPALAAWVYSLNTLPWLAGLAAVNFLTWRAYAADKRRARSGAWRIPESTLHLFELSGGWPAAFMAQRRLRHKCAKKSYQIVFWLIVGLYQFAAFDSLHRFKYSLQAWDQLGHLVADQRSRR